MLECRNEVINVGAPGKYAEWLTEDGLILIKGWARNGLTYEQIAHNMGITRNTLNEWRNRYQAIDDALKRTREIVDLEVENALYKRAMGYDYDEEIYQRKVDKNTCEENLELIKKVTKHVPPDTTAQIFWLKNRKPEEWRDKREVAVEADENTTGIALIAPVIEEGSDGKA
jgi:transcriptional regulator with XRE-family HTH domain